MRRRTFLAGVAAGTVAVAGCSGTNSPSSNGTDDPPSTLKPENIDFPAGWGADGITDVEAAQTSHVEYLAGLPSFSIAGSQQYGEDEPVQEFEVQASAESERFYRTFGAPGEETIIFYDGGDIFGQSGGDQIDPLRNLRIQSPPESYEEMLEVSALNAILGEFAQFTAEPTSRTEINGEGAIQYRFTGDRPEGRDWTAIEGECTVTLSGGFVDSSISYRIELQDDTEDPDDPSERPEEEQPDQGDLYRYTWSVSDIGETEVTTPDWV